MEWARTDRGESEYVIISPFGVSRTGLCPRVASKNRTCLRVSFIGIALPIYVSSFDLFGLFCLMMHELLADSEITE